MLSVLVLDSLLVLKVCKQSRCASSWQLYSYKYAFSAAMCNYARCLLWADDTQLYANADDSAFLLSVSIPPLPLVLAIRACVLDFYVCTRATCVRVFVRVFFIFQSAPNVLCSRVRHARSFSERLRG